MIRDDLDDLLEVERGLVLVNLWETGDEDGLAVAMDSLEERMGRDVRILRLPAGEVPEIVRRYRVRGTPVCLAFLDGRLVARWRGTMDGRELARRCTALLEGGGALAPR